MEVPTVIRGDYNWRVLLLVMAVAYIHYLTIELAFYHITVTHELRNSNQ